MELKKEDIQGLVVSSYSHLPCAHYVLLRIKDSAAARAWLSRHIEKITTAEGKEEEFSVNLAFTNTGLTAIGLSEDILKTFSRPFQEGMATEHRSRILGDGDKDKKDENAAAFWEWGGPCNPVDLVLLMYAKDETTLDTQLQLEQQQFSAVFKEPPHILDAGRQPNDNREHFGFHDGVGQPVMEGTGNEIHQQERTHHATVVRTGEFLMGHVNEYKETADSPVVAAADDPNHLLCPVPLDTTGLNAKAGMHDLGLNGSYLVFRQLAQHVAQFWSFLDQATRDAEGNSDPWASERLGAKFVGRWKSGAPLVLSPKCDDRTLGNENDFSYREQDSKGFACPIGAHIRRSNPRGSNDPDAQTALDSAKRHRILRRGRSYGHRLHNPLVDDGAPRGLHFICLNSDIERQFEFVQQTWINNPVFGGLYGEVDPLIGNLAKGDAIFTVQGDPLRTRVHNLSRFVTVKGGAYFFLPSIRALNYLARL
jgi:Dyp-type peroxidase family